LTVKVLIVFASLFLVVLIWSCADEITPPPSVTHPAEWNTLNSAEFHGNKAMTAGYESCITCHGSDYRGGSSGTSCYTCHSETAGMEACNLCHGNRNAPVLALTSWAPPQDLSQDTVTTAIGVGAHQIHLSADTWSTAYTRDCDLCHPAMTGFDDPGHIDKQEGINVQFGGMASWQDKLLPRWDQATASCSNTYCHGNFIFRKSASAIPDFYETESMLGNNQEMVWTQVGSGQAACGTCHLLPPMGHIDVEVSCNNCHGAVVDADNHIIDKSKHINGSIDLN
jgi:hypothetical protein